VTQRPNKTTTEDGELTFDDSFWADVSSRAERVASIPVRLYDDVTEDQLVIDDDFWADVAERSNNVALLIAPFMKAISQPSDSGLVEYVLAIGAPLACLTPETVRTLNALDPTVSEITGYTRYRIEGRPLNGDANVTVIDRGGIARDLPSRTDRIPRLRGTKHQVAAEQRVLAARGRYDGRTTIIVPEVKNGQTTGITLLHVRYVERLPTAVLRTVLSGYRDRFRTLEDAVLETEPTFREDLLETFDVTGLLIEPVAALADRWRE
jgi:hypothetical protein